MKMKQLNVNAALHTNGSGYWSRIKKEVEIKGLSLIVWFDDEEPNTPSFGDFRVAFNTKTWDVNKDGLIYSDNRFLKELKVLLASIGLPTKVCYSEQGMQGDDFVSFDVNGKFCVAFMALAPKAVGRGFTR